MMYRAISLNKEASWNSSSDCARASLLHKEQRLVCERHVELMTSLVHVAQDVIDVCQDLFADKRWNCSSVQLTPNYLPDLTGGIPYACMLPIHVCVGTMHTTI